MRLRRAAKGWFTTPPHSPLHTLVAGSAFAAPEHGAGPLRRLVLFTAILVGCAAALQPLAAAATQAALFGMVEVRAASYVALPQWVRVMHGMARLVQR